MMAMGGGLLLRAEAPAAAKHPAVHRPATCSTDSPQPSRSAKLLGGCSALGESGVSSPGPLCYQVQEQSSASQHASFSFCLFFCLNAYFSEMIRKSVK